MHLISIRTTCFTQQKQWGLYQNKVNSNLAAIQRPGHRADNCKMVYCSPFFFFVRHVEFLGGLPLYTRSQTPVPGSPLPVARCPLPVARCPLPVARSPLLLLVTSVFWITPTNVSISTDKGSSASRNVLNKTSKKLVSVVNSWWTCQYVSGCRQQEIRLRSQASQYTE